MILSEINQNQKRTFCTISFIWRWKNKTKHKKQSFLMFQMAHVCQDCVPSILQTPHWVLQQASQRCQSGSLPEIWNDPGRLDWADEIQTETESDPDAGGHHQTECGESLWNQSVASSSHSCQLRNPGWHTGHGLEDRSLPNVTCWRLWNWLYLFFL